MGKDKADFRFRRYKLPPESFLIHPKGPEPPPKDIVEKQVWRGIVWLADDVSIRTSDNHGVELKAMYELWGSVIDLVSEKEKDAIWHVLLDVADNMQATMFNSLCGFYRVAVSSLRAALEVSVIGVHFQLNLSTQELFDWQEGRRKIGFGEACDHLIGNERVKPLEKHLKEKHRETVFDQRSHRSTTGWARRLYSELSDFAHSRPTHSEGMLWEGSNGPVYVRSSFGRIYAYYLDTCALIYVLAKLCRKELGLHEAGKWLFRSSNVKPSRVAVASFSFLWDSSTEP